ncbi:response regulator transcription factor [Sinorhizobium psoraleae]|uniref:Response regulator transcription factor n=1 Tax=Sinorhizobium psoraleae TaxID=520838 RepID=A0ABT4KAC4_9HYPH|nr:response regulator transcription factor [Sinorhizobium psoraleae]MCZ4088784.1 response regulator transcription factor [Sinorhizobium psoraleae]
MRILVVEDDAVLLDGLKIGLGLSGFTVDAVATFADASEALAADRFDAVVLDRMLPGGSGLEVLARLRERDDRTPVLLLTAKDETADRIEGLDAGADDYLGKPFDLDEVAARLRAITRRAEGRARPELRCGDIVLDPAGLAARKGDTSIPLSRREFSVLRTLMENPGMIHSKQALEQRLYGWQEDVESNTVEVHVHKLRAKLGASSIETVRGVGYRMGKRV